MANLRLSAAMAAGLIWLAGAAGWAADTVTFRANDVQKPEAPAVQGMLKFGEILRERSNGRLSVEVNTESNDSGIYTIGQVRNGSLDMARISLSMLGGYAPSAEVLSMPYIFSSHAEMYSVLAGEIGDHVIQELESQGLVVLCFYEAGARSFYGSRPIRVAADVSGLTIQVPGSEMSSEIVRALGAQPLPLPFSQTRSALASGAASASEGNWIGYVSARHYEVAPYYSQTEHVRIPDVLAFSKQVWDKLTASDRQLIRNAARDSVAYQCEMLDAFEQTARRTAEAGGAKIIDDVDRKSLADALAPLRHKLLTDPRQRQLLDRIRTPGVAVAPDHEDEPAIPLPK